MFTALNIYSKEYLTETSQVYLKNENSPLISGVYILTEIYICLILKEMFFIASISTYASSY